MKGGGAIGESKRAVCLLPEVVFGDVDRRSDLIESIHDGSYFGGDWTKLGLFLPAGIVLLL